MRNLLNPKWVFIINTFPIIVLFFLFSGEFSVIKTLLNAESISLWKSFGLALAVLGAVNFIYAVYLSVKKKVLSVYYGVWALLCHIPFIYLYSNYFDRVVPFSIPRWMVSDNVMLYVGTFLMPTLAHGLFVLVVQLTPHIEGHKAWKNFLIAAATPIAWYVFSQVIIPLWKSFEDNFMLHTLVIFVILGGLVFLFFLIRGILILATKRKNIWREHQLMWKIPISIVLPLIGLVVNNGDLFNYAGVRGYGVFGDFNNYWFYILAFINGVFICMPDLKHKIYRLFLFVGRSVFFAYTLYFFLVFLPFLPLSIVAVIAIGMGFLMLTPLVLFVVHVNELSNDFAYLKAFFPKGAIYTFAFLGFLIIPIFVTIDYLGDRKNLNGALAYIYSPSYSRKYDIDKESLRATMNVVRRNKNNRRSLAFSSQAPYLSTYFNWLVLDNLTLSDKKINTLENVFFGVPMSKFPKENLRNKGVDVTAISVRSRFDNNQGAWLSWIDLEITNKNQNNWFAEYSTTFELPQGCWVSDYYLYVGDRKEKGILAEKKSAMWVFSSIRSENKDPGILYYLTGNRVRFRVFPFAKGEVRRTGIELLHKDPVKISIDSNIIELGNKAGSYDPDVKSEHVVYVSAKEKRALKKIKRKPYFHFLVDATEGKDMASYAERIEKVAESNKQFVENAKISFVNTYVSTHNYERDWEKNDKGQDFGGGFYLDRAIRKALFHSYKHKSNTYPILVVVSDSLQKAYLEGDFANFAFAFPEGGRFFYLKEDGNLESHSLVLNPREVMRDTIPFAFDQLVLEYECGNGIKAYLPDNQRSSIFLKTDILELSEIEAKEKSWETALAMQGKWMSQTLHPETSGTDWLDLVKYSFVSKVMTPVTAYLVVENEAQKAILKKKQEQVLAGNKSLDIDESTRRMSEPGMFILAILLGFALWVRQKGRG